MRKELKPGRYYLIVNVDEPYAEDVYEVIKHGQMQKEADGENAWPEGDIPFAKFLSDCWPGVYDGEQVRLARITGTLTPDRDRYRLVSALRSRIATLEAQLEQAREAVRQHCAACAEACEDGVFCHLQVLREGGETLTGKESQ